MEVQGKIKLIETFLTWPHYKEKGFFTSALFARSDDDKAYLIYCPKVRSSISIEEDSYSINEFWFRENFIREIKLTQTLNKVGDVLFYVIEIDRTQTEIKKKDIESLFGIKVID